MEWGYIVYGVVSLLLTVASIFLRPSQKAPKTKAEDSQIPAPVPGAKIPVLFGTRLIESPNVVWYGDMKTQPIKLKSGKK